MIEIFKGLKFKSITKRWYSVIDIEDDIISLYYKDYRNNIHTVKHHIDIIKSCDFILPSLDNPLPEELRVSDWKKGDVGYYEYNGKYIKFEYVSNEYSICNTLVYRVIRIGGEYDIYHLPVEILDSTGMRIEDIKPLENTNKVKEYSLDELKKCHNKPNVTNCVKCSEPLTFLFGNIPPYCKKCEG